MSFPFWGKLRLCMVLCEILAHALAELQVEIQRLGDKQFQAIFMPAATLSSSSL